MSAARDHEGPLPPDTSRGGAFMLVNWVTMSIALLIVGLRIYTRACVRRTAGWDDWIILLSLV